VHHITPFRAFGYVAGENDNHRLANRLENLILLCSACHRRVERAQGSRGALSGLGYVLRSLAPLYVMCAPGDLGSSVEMQARGTGLPTVTLYDRAQGGAGLSPRLYDIRTDLLAAALEAVRGCPCEAGCPACVGPIGENEGRVKELTARLLEAMLAAR
jgi:DEAD/DEAH box helicase domain-containing protein